MIAKQRVLLALTAEALEREPPTVTSAHLEARSIWVAAAWQHRYEHEKDFSDLDGVLLIISGRPPFNLDNWLFDVAKMLSDDLFPEDAFAEFVYELAYGREEDK